MSVPEITKRVGDVMNRSVRIVRREQSLAEAAEMMRRANVGALPVCDHGRLAGMVTDRDIAIRAATDIPPEDARVDAVMTTGIEYCYEAQSLDEALALMASAGVRRLPVLDVSQNVIGMVSIDDIACDDGKLNAESTLTRINAHR